jgi:hypothetical protein
MAPKGWTVSKTENTPAADPVADRLAQLDALIEEQKARLAAIAPAPAVGLTGDDLKSILKATKEEQDATRSIRHSNADHRHISAFSHPEGDLKAPKPKLIRETYFNNHRESEDELTPAEIDAYNAITHTCSARSDQWTARVKGNRLLVDVPSYTMDDRMNLPDGLVLILRELAQGERAVTPADMAARIADLERQVKSMGGGVVLASA